MISIKAISALGLTGLGAATMTTDVYLANKAPSAPPLSIVYEPLPAMPPEAQPVAVPEPVPTPSLELAPMIIYARAAHPAPAPTTSLAACSEWRALDSGPAGRGVRTLCMADVPVNATPRVGSPSRVSASE
jgi:hypothetical protein